MNLNTNHSYLMQIFLDTNRKIALWLVLKDDNLSGGDNLTSEEMTTFEEKMELVDEHKLFLMGTILLFSSFGLSKQLEQLNLIEAIQADMVTLLQRYLVYQYGPEKSVEELARAMDIIAMTREALEIQRRRLPV